MIDDYERKQLMQDVIDRTLPSYPHSEDFIADLQDLIRSHSTGMKEVKGVRFYCELTNVNADDIA